MEKKINNNKINKIKIKLDNLKEYVEFLENKVEVLRKLNDIKDNRIIELTQDICHLEGYICYLSKSS